MTQPFQVANNGIGGPAAGREKPTARQRPLDKAVMLERRLRDQPFRRSFG